MQAIGNRDSKLVVELKDWEAAKASAARQGEVVDKETDGARIGVRFDFTNVSDEMPRMMSLIRSAEKCILPSSSFYGGISHQTGYLPW